MPVNRKKIDITINKKIKKGTKKLTPSGRASLSSRGGAIANTNEVREFVSPNDISEVEKAPIINYDFMVNSDKTNSLFDNKPKKVLSERALKRVKEIRNK